MFGRRVPVEFDFYGKERGFNNHIDKILKMFKGKNDVLVIKLFQPFDGKTQFVVNIAFVMMQTCVKTLGTLFQWVGGGSGSRLRVGFI